MTTRWLAVGLLTLGSGCGEIASYPFSFDMSLSVDEIAPGDVPVEGEFETTYASEVADFAAMREELPDGAAGMTRIDLLEMTIESPDLGPIGTWMSVLSVYASVDDVLSANDVFVGEAELTPERSQVTFPLGDDVDALTEGDGMAMILQVTMRSLPDQPFSIPVAADGEALVDPL